VERFGRVHGGAFPSAHVVGALVPWLAARRFARRLAWGMAPLVLGVLVSTVYGGYHYVADILAGLVVGVTAWALVSRIELIDTGDRAPAKAQRRNLGVSRQEKGAARQPDPQRNRNDQ